MPRAAIGLGSNRGDRLANLRRALRLVRETVGSVTQTSDIFETPPWGVLDQARFLNACLIVETDLSPYNLLDRLKEIERLVGRQKSERWGPREVDLDILLYDDLLIRDDNLNIPHKHMHERAFVLLPLNQIAPDWVRRDSGRSVSELFSNLDGKSVEGIVRITSL